MSAALLHLKAQTLARWLSKLEADGPEPSLPGVPVCQLHRDRVRRLAKRIETMRAEARSQDARGAR